MAPLRLNKIQPILALFAFLILWWMLPNSIKYFLKNSFEEFQAPLWIATDKLENFSKELFLNNLSKKQLIENIIQLKRKNAYYNQLVESHSIQKEEITRLENIFNLKTNDSFHYEIARVIKRDIGSWWQKILINKGTINGLKPGDAVIFKDGVVGRILETNYYTSLVDLISSQTFRVSASFKGDNRPLVYQGFGVNYLGQPHGSIMNAPQDIVTSTHAPLTLITTGLGGTFPAGIKLGYVPWLEPDNTGLFQAGEVQLEKSLLSIKEVVVLIPYNRLEEFQDDI